MTFHRFKTAESGLSWKPRPKGGFQFFGVRESCDWWLYFNNKFLCRICRVTKESGGGWMLWYCPGTNPLSIGPRFPTLFKAAKEARKAVKRWEQNKL